MSDDVLIPYGFRDRSLIHISEAVAGLACGCNCFGCGKPLIAKKGNVRIHHFAHAYVGQCVGRETLLHAMGKQLLQDRFEHSISSGNPLWLKWRCRTCGDEHSGSFKQVRAVAVEKAIGGYTPDLTLSDDRGRPIAAIEVVVTHEPDPEAIRYYADQGIMVIEFHLNDFDDLSRITDPTGLLPNKVGFCPRPRCIRCRKVLSKQFIAVVDVACPKCRKPMPLAFKELGTDEKLPEQVFYEKEITKGTELGANLKERYCRVEKVKYTGNVCPGCDTFLPRSEIPEIIRERIEESDVEPEIKRRWLGYGCPKCDVLRPQKPTVPKTEIESPKESTPSVTSECVAARMVDFHFQNGKKFREVYYVRAYFRGGEAYLYQVTNQKHRVLARAGATEKRKILAAVDADIEAIEKRALHCFDQTGWRPWGEAANRFHPRQFDRFPWKLLWDENTGDWENPPEPVPQLPVLNARRSLGRDFVSRLFPTDSDGWESSVAELQSRNREGTCKICGKVTTDWWVYEGATGMCKCRGCY